MHIKNKAQESALLTQSNKTGNLLSISKDVLHETILPEGRICKSINEILCHFVTICKYFIAEKGKKLLATSIRLKRQYSENPDLLGVHLAVVLDVLGALTLSPVGVGHHLPQPLLPLRIVQRRRRSGRRRGRLFAPLARSAPATPLFITSSVGLGGPRSRTRWSSARRSVD